MVKVNAVAFLLLVLLFAIWFYGPWQTLCIDWARERMFEARNALFDMAAEGKLSFSSPEYRELRYRIETSIRFAHRTSWPTLLILLSVSRRLRIPRPRSTREIIKKLPVQWQEEAEKHTRTVEWVILRLLITRSMILLVAFAVVWVMVRCGAPIYWFCRRLSEQLIEATQNEALEDAVISSRRHSRACAGLEGVEHQTQRQCNRIGAAYRLSVYRHRLPTTLRSSVGVAIGARRTSPGSDRSH